MIILDVGVALGAQVRHVVTYRDPPEGTLIYTVFAKKCQKRSKKGVPLFLTGFELCTTYRGGTRGGSSKSKMSSVFGCLAEDNGQF